MNGDEASMPESAAPHQPRFRWDGRHMVWLRGDARTSASAAKRMVSRPPYGEPLPGRLLATLVVELKTADSRQRIRFRDGTGHRAQGQRLTVSRGYLWS